MPIFKILINPFGMLMRERSFSSGEYRYGFNGKEMDDVIKGEGNSYDFGARMFDPRIGRWFSPDRLEGHYPSYSTYNYVLNNPMYFIDPSGNGPLDWYKDKFGNYVYDKNVKSQADVGNRGTYKGEIVLLNHRTTRGQWMNTFQLNADGSVVDSFGNNYMDNFGELTIGSSGVKIINEYTFEERWEKHVIDNLYKASDWVRSLEGNGTVRGSGFKFSGELGLNAYSIAFDVGTYSGYENSVGIYSKFSFNKKDFDLSGGVSNGWGSAGSALISLLPKVDFGGYMYVNTKDALDMNPHTSTTNSVMGQYGLFRIGSNDSGESVIGFGTGTSLIPKLSSPYFNPDKGVNLNSTESTPITPLSGATSEIKLN